MTGADRFEAFVRAHQDMVFATALRLLGSRVDAEDIAQTVFLRAFQRFAEIGDRPFAAAWLRTVTRNACLNYLARHRRRWRLFSELADPREGGSEAALEAMMPSSASPADALESADERERLERALARLPDHQRVPLVLFHIEGMSYQEIAGALSVSIGKIKTDIHRGREALRKQLNDDADR
jgi:RNA polymerase sigma-70 factor, ECF subfamily